MVREPLQDGPLVPHRSALVALLTTLSTASLVAQTTPSTRPPAGPPPAPCVADSAARRFDFWIGDWDVSPAGHPEVIVGHSVVEKISGGCALLENWTATNGSNGKSLNAFNRPLGHWQQYWVGSGGGVTEYRDSEWRGDTLVYLARSSSPKGAFLQRLSFSSQADGSVRQFAELSTDDGKTWSVGYDFYYRHHGEGGGRR